MKLIKPSVKILNNLLGNDIKSTDRNNFSKEDILKHIFLEIELAGRTCYKSEDKITDTSAEKFVEMLIQRNHCFTGDSEVLTIEGWKKWKDYKGEQVGTVNPDGTFKGFETPMHVINGKYDGTFYKYNTLGITVTDKHRMFGMFANKYEDRYSELNPEMFLPNTPYKDNNGRNKTLGERFFRTPTCCNYTPDLQPFYQLIGFWLGDGCVDSSANQLKFHLKKKRKIEYLKHLCNSLQYEFKELANNKYCVVRENIHRDFTNTFLNEGTKIYPHYYGTHIFSLNDIYSIIDGLISSDGSIQKTGISFTNTSKQIIEWLEFHAPLVGYTLSNISSSLIDNTLLYKIFFLRRNYSIQNDSRRQSSKVKIFNDKEDVYCVTVSTGLILVRGINGVVSICGNCAMLEHGTVYLTVDDGDPDEPIEELVRKYQDNRYSVVQLDNGHTSVACGYYITTNYRVIIENGWEDDLQHLCLPTEHHEKRILVRFICDRGVSHKKFVA